MAWKSSAEDHPAVVETALRAHELGPERRLRLWQEVFVLPAGAGHSFEYVNCHPATGLIPFIEPPNDQCRAGSHARAGKPLR